MKIITFFKSLVVAFVWGLIPYLNVTANNNTLPAGSDLTVRAGEPTGAKLFYDNFEYELGNLAGNGDWNEYKYFNMGGDPVIALVNSPLTYPGYQSQAKGLAIELNGKGMDASAQFQGVGGIVYASMLVKVNEASEPGNVIFAFNEGTKPHAYNCYGKLIVKKTGDKLAFGITQNLFAEGSTVYSEANYDFNQPVLLVVKYYQGPDKGDDYVELFVNPDISGAEPQRFLKTTEVSVEPPTNLCHINLIQHSATDDNYNMLIDAIRLATSWEGLFDESPVELVPEVVTPSKSYNLGTMKPGDEPLETILNIKAKNLKSDLTVSGLSEGYYTLSATTIKKEEAESEKGFDLKILLNAGNGRVKNDLITIAGTLVNYQVSIQWDFEATPTGVKLFDDKFEYVTGNLAGNGDWKEYKYFNNGGDPVIELVNSPLSYPDYQNLATGLAVQLNGKGMDASAEFQGVGGVVYASMLVSVEEASEAGNAIFAFNAGKTPDAYTCFGKLIVRKVGDKLAFGITQYLFVENNTVFSEANYDFNQPVLLVVKYYQGPRRGDDYAELFINPVDIYGSEPEISLKATSGAEFVTEPDTNIRFINLIQNSATDDNYKVLVDAMRVATSWEALFDGAPVGLAPEIIVEQGAKINLGLFEQGSDPLETVLKIRGKNLKSDLSVEVETDGYCTISATSIKKVQAEREIGFDLKLTLNPKDGKSMSDLITIAGTMAGYPVLVEWKYRAKADFNTVSEFGTVELEGKYTLVNAVHVEKIAETGIGSKYFYTLKDESGTLDVLHMKGSLETKEVDNIRKGNDVRNLCILVTYENREEGLTPVYTIADSPNLEITTGIKNSQEGSITGFAEGMFIAEGAKNIEAYDVNGKHLLGINGEVLSMNELPDGMYIVQFTDKTGKTHMIKVVK